MIINTKNENTNSLMHKRILEGIVNSGLHGDFDFSEKFWQTYDIAQFKIKFCC